MSRTFNIPADFPIKTVLVVDDDPGLRSIVARSLERSGFKCMLAADAIEALDLAGRETFDLVISDISMPGDMDGIDLLKQLKVMDPDMSVIIMTGYGGEYSYVDIMEAGAADYMTKPFNMNSALARINRIAREKTHLINLKKSNLELCQAIDRSNILAREAKEASKAKTFFLASMSHEIRTPLNGIVGYTDMLMDTPLNDEQRLFLKNARLSCDTLLSVVNDILDFSKVEAGKLTLEKIEFDPEVLCFDTIDVVRTKVDESRVEFLCSVADSVPGKIIGDPHRFRQVLLNLLGNAAKFTEKGSIHLSVDAREKADQRVELTVTVKDTGIGIAEDQVDKIFKPFIQSEDDITNRYGGTGLGLAISKNIALKMSGDVWVESTPKKGSCFYFKSIADIALPKQVMRVKPASLKGKSVLLCTTSDETANLYSTDFKLAGMHVKHVPYKEIQQFFVTADLSGFDIGLIDFGKIAKIDMERFAESISALIPDPLSVNFVACSIPVPGIADVFQTAGFKGFLPKPVRRKKLFEMLAYVMGIHNLDPGDSESSPNIITSHSMSENKKHSVSILLVEDNPVNQKMTRLMLTKAGYSVQIAGNGKDAVDLYEDGPDRYDIVLMDINMPLMDGFEATTRIRDFEVSAGIEPKVPILALTANVLDDFRKRCTDCGMDDFLTKPIKRDIVFQAIRKWTNSGG